MQGVRIRLAMLWLSQVARNVADHSLRVFVVLKAAEAGAAARDSAWHLAIALFALPAVLLAPVNGAVSNSLAKRWVLVGSAAFCLGVTALFCLIQGAWFACLGLAAVGSALYFPTRYALLAPAAQDAHLPPPRVNGLVEMGANSAIVAGAFLGAFLYGNYAAWALLVVAGLNLLGLLTAFPAAFPSDVRRPEAAGQAVVGFFRDSRRILRDPATRWPLLAWSTFRGLVAAITGAFIAVTLSRAAAGEGQSTWQAFLTVAVWILAGVAVGSILAGLQGHAHRSLGLVPLAALGLAFTLIGVSIHASPAGWVFLLVGVMVGLINVPLYSAYQASLPADARGNGMAILNTAGNACMLLMGLLTYGLTRFRVLGPTGQLWFVAVLTGAGALVAWRALFRECLEQIMEVMLAPIYRVRGHGPGLDHCPRRGPVLVVANHSAYFDPLWLGNVLPRRIIPLMTSLFYDLPVMRWLMVHVVHAIRVPSATFRRETPELDEAIAALDRGECVVIFPEGMLRRRPEQLLRQFGQGVWHILHERPDTPVIVCWIEGGWGSYTSYAGGPPMTHKRMDWWRHIDIAVSDPRVLDAELLADDRITRSYLMDACREARRLLGLSVESEKEDCQLKIAN